MGSRFWIWTWLAVVACIWAGGFAYGEWEAGLRQAMQVTALGGVDGQAWHVWFWRGLFGSILWTGAAAAMAIATADSGRHHRASGEATAAW